MRKLSINPGIKDQCLYQALAFREPGDRPDPSAQKALECSSTGGLSATSPSPPLRPTGVFLDLLRAEGSSADQGPRQWPPSRHRFGDVQRAERCRLRSGSGWQAGYWPQLGRQFRGREEQGPGRQNRRWRALLMFFSIELSINLFVSVNFRSENES